MNPSDRIHSRTNMQNAQPMFCKNCGHKIAPEGSFCPECGTRTGTATQEPQAVTEDMAFSQESTNGNGHKKPLKTLCAGAVVILVICGAIFTKFRGTSDSSGSKNSSKDVVESPISDNLNWTKSHFTDGTLYICTDFLIPGTMTNSSNEKSDAYMQIFQDKNGYFLTLFDANGNSIQNASDTAVSINAEYVWYEGEQNEFRKVFQATVGANDRITRLSGEATAPMQGSLNGAYGDTDLFLSIPGGDTYRFIIPEKTNYYEIWEAVCDFWYIPTYNDEIYNGDEVNPDLVIFLNRFVKALNDEIKVREQVGTVQTLLNDLLSLESSNNDLSRMYIQYMELELYRTVDAEYYAQIKSDVDIILIQHAVHQTAEIIRESGYEDEADMIDMGLKLFKQLMQ